MLSKIFLTIAFLALSLVSHGNEVTIGSCEDNNIPYSENSVIQNGDDILICKKIGINEEDKAFFYWEIRGNEPYKYDEFEMSEMGITLEE